ncbi:MAG: glutamine synthetase type III [Desulfobulbus sp.]|nr:MAG: glutamine synthetase type III [Desulfobulbus sp.]
MSGSNAREQAIFEITNRAATKVGKRKTLDKIWASDVFTLAKMEQALSKKAYKAMKNTMETGAPLDPQVADSVAAAMKDWAIDKGADYFSHIFYPLTGFTAEKHDGFILTEPGGKAITEFNGDLLIKGEPDGSSFPNGGIRQTSAARGYTAWDPTSPAYILKTKNGATLCIPSVFISWTGESMDKKVPLLRSNAAMNEAATKVLKKVGERNVAPLNSSCGAEQEYFLVDANFASLRPDLLLTGRTLFGAAPAKGQEFDDHYFGAIADRVLVFMQAVEEKLYRLGIPAKTRHNEVAPAQFEIAPYFEAANVAADHQQMLMTVLKSTAKEHGFVCLLHEKPFAGINGSGKHVNWSVGNSTQGNLLDPGDKPNENLNFLLFCGAVIRGVHLYGPLLRAVVASAGNDHRLGANEAPPAILSVYLGSQIEGIFDQIAKGKLDSVDESGLMDLGLSQIIPFVKDAGDRNRTSPFAFTGNRFEFRAVGSDQSVAGALTAMNTMLADSLNWMAGELDKAIAGKSNAAIRAGVIKVLKKVMKEHGAVVFGGDGYSAAWHKEAVEKRGLKNLPTSADALPALRYKEVVKLFESTGVLSPVELEARFEVDAEIYLLKIAVEAKLVVSIATKTIYPAAMNYLSDLAQAAVSAAELGVSFDKSVAKSIAANVNGMMKAVGKLQKAMAKDNFKSVEKHMQFCAGDIRGLMDEVRGYVDALEAEVADELWPLPTYEEMLFIK